MNDATQSKATETTTHITAEEYIILRHFAFDDQDFGAARPEEATEEACRALVRRGLLAGDLDVTDAGRAAFRLIDLGIGDGECPCGCGVRARMYTIQGFDGYLDAAPKCAVHMMVDCLASAR